MLFFFILQQTEWFGHVTRRNRLSQTIPLGTLEGGRRRGRQRKCWLDDAKEWTSLPMSELLTMMSRRKIDWKRICAEWSLMSPCQPNRSQDRAELNVLKKKFYRHRHYHHHRHHRHHHHQYQLSKISTRWVTCINRLHGSIPERS